MTNSTNDSRLDILCRKARTISRSGEYLPGRVHFATIVAARLETEVLATKAFNNNGNGRCTAYELAMRMAMIAGDMTAHARMHAACRAIIKI